jgi:hypothetical protein
VGGITDPSQTHSAVGSCLRLAKQAGHRRRRYSLGCSRGGGSGNGFLGGSGDASLPRLRPPGAAGVGVADADDALRGRRGVGVEGAFCSLVRPRTGEGAGEDGGGGGAGAGGGGISGPTTSSRVLSMMPW